GRSMQQRAAMLRIQRTGEKLLPGLPQLFEPASIDRCNLRFELATQSLREGRTMSSSRNSDLQVPAPNDSGIIKIAALRIVHDVAQNSSKLSFAISEIVHIRDGSRDHHEEDRVQIGWLKRPRIPLQRPGSRPGGPSRRCTLRRQA